MYVTFNALTLFSVVELFCSGDNCYVLSVAAVINAYLLSTICGLSFPVNSKKNKSHTLQQMTKRGRFSKACYHLVQIIPCVRAQQKSCIILSEETVHILVYTSRFSVPTQT